MKLSTLKINIFSSIFLLLFLSCTKDQITVYTATIYNNSGKDLVIIPIKAGISSDTIIIAKDSNLLISDGWEFGDLQNPHFYSKYFDDIDSVIIVFENIFHVTHYFVEPSFFNEKYHTFESNRNIFNRENYEFEKIRNEKERINIHRYYFTEADYEFAKD